MNTSKQLKDLINNKAKQYNLNPQILLQLIYNNMYKIVCKICQYFSKMSQIVKNISRNYNLLFCCTFDHNKQPILNALMISKDD